VSTLGCDNNCIISYPHLWPEVRRAPVEVSWPCFFTTCGFSPESLAAHAEVVPEIILRNS
jgi:hypothetical protein